MKKLLSLVLVMLLVFAFAAFAEEEESIITVAIGSQFSTLDPALNTEVVNNYVINHCYSGLFESDEGNVPQPDLCESYTLSDDGLVYTFTLKQGCEWSDGVEITADQFEYSYLRALSYGPDNVWAINDMMSYIVGAADYNAAALEMGNDFDCLTEDHSYVGIEAVDDYTFVLTLIKPCAYFTNLLCGNAWTAVRADFAPQHESLWSFEAGYPASGAYILEYASENEGATITKNPNYYNADAILNDGIEYVVMPDPSAEAMAYMNGEVDLCMTISAETALSYEGTDSLWLMPNVSSYFIAINSGSTGPEWAKNKNVRKALYMAIDKDALVDVLGGPVLYPPLNGYVPSGLAGVNGDFRAEKDAEGTYQVYDPEGAKALLAQEGYDESNPLTVKYKYSNNGMHGDVAAMVEYMWSQIGVNVVLECVESGVFYDQLDQGDFETSRYGYVAGDDPMQYLELWTTQIQVVAAVDDPEYDKMCEEARYIVDKTEYLQKLHEIEDYLIEENFYEIPLFNYTTPTLASTEISGYTQHGGALWCGGIVK